MHNCKLFNDRQGTSVARKIFTRFVIRPFVLFIVCFMFHFVLDAQLQVIQRQAGDQSGQGDYILEYILKAKKFTESAFQLQKNCGKSA